MYKKRDSKIRKFIILKDKDYQGIKTKIYCFSTYII